MLLSGDPIGSVLLREHLSLRLPVREEAGLLATGPRGPLLRAADVPVGTASLEDGAQVEAQLLHRRPAEKPVAVVDLVDTKAGLEHERVRDHRVVLRVRVLRDVEILLHLATRIREKRPVGADSAAEL